MAFLVKDCYSFDDLVEIMKILRSPDGCPWDREQTHSSIRRNLIEETYEAVEAIDEDDPELLKEELGDVLLQVVFHSQISVDNGSFSIDDVSDGICKKLILRHPHVFGDVSADTSEQVLNNWDKIKMESKSQVTYAQAMYSVSKALPSLIRSSKIQQKAKKVGFDFPDPLEALSKVSEEAGELKAAIISGDNLLVEEELGDLLFSAVNVSRLLDIDAEKALSKSCEKFIKRFEKLENLAKQRGTDIESATLYELDSLWNEVKINS